MNDEYLNAKVFIGKLKALYSPHTLIKKGHWDEDYLFNLIVGGELVSYIRCCEVKDSVEQALWNAGNSFGRKLNAIGISEYSIINGKILGLKEGLTCEPLPEQHVDKLKETIEGILTKRC